MADSLVIVESPAKAKTIGKYLGSKYIVKASMGHVRDLPKSQIGVEVENDFTAEIHYDPRQRQRAEGLKDASKKVKSVYLAADPDREGEAIAWHLANYLELPEDEPCRVVFNEITKQAVKEAFKSPRRSTWIWSMPSRARRILDRLVGYKISPLLWKKVKKGLSAGRVQSVAVKLIIDRENEIRSFVPEEYWTITAKLADGSGRIRSEILRPARGEKGAPNEEEVQRNSGDARRRHFVVAVRQGERTAAPSGPAVYYEFAAAGSGPQAELPRSENDVGRPAAVRRRRSRQRGKRRPDHVHAYRFHPRFAGRPGRGPTVYCGEIRKCYVPETPASIRRKTPGAQDAHEAIRPTSVMRDPER